MCRTIQGVIVLVISNRLRASHSSDFEITRAITPGIVLHSVQLLLLITQKWKQRMKHPYKEMQHSVKRWDDLPSGITSKKSWEVNYL